MPRTLHVGLALWPRKSAQWFELGLKTSPDIRVCHLSSEALESATKLDLLVMDGDQPGPGFLGNYHAYLKSFGICDLVVLGQPGCPSLMNLEWEPARTFFIAKPYLIEDALKTVQNRLGEIVLRESQVAVPPPPPGGTVSPQREAPISKGKSLGYLSTLRLADLIQMLCLSNWTGKIDIENLASGERGYVFMEDGHIRDSRHNQHQGEHACHQMLNWGRCNFEFTEDLRPETTTVHNPWQQILLEGARIFDEGLLK
ncbi:MAG: DUF4388 domain-containing protein [Candidatus Methylacidiphilales bacterium]|nr:DUF4388 domain-containing protein [Candidatus Methylacidiphilales bacterium]